MLGGQTQWDNAKINNLREAFPSFGQEISHKEHSIKEHLLSVIYDAFLNMQHGRFTDRIGYEVQESGFSPDNKG